MRINVYDEELTGEVTIERKVAGNTGIAYYGVRVWLHSADVLHSGADDDDRSCVTFWTDDIDLADRARDLIKRGVRVLEPTK